MSIDPNIATAIVESIKDVINHEINFFDTAGAIIASTDRSRVGTFHGGAWLAVETGRTVVVDDRHPFEGARSGINMPVMLNGSAVAVVGVTGEVDEVEPLGAVVEKMTEILIRENFERIMQFDRRMMMSNLMNLLTLEHHDQSLLDYLASALRVDLARPRQAAVGQLLEEQGSPPAQDEVQKALREHLAFSFNTMFCVTAKGCFILLDQAESPDWEPVLEQLCNDFESTLGVRFAFGLGSIENDPSQYWRSYDEARTAVDWRLFEHQSGVMRFASLDRGLLFSSVPQDKAQSFIDHVFAGLSPQEITDSQAVFDAYTRHNGSITHAAQELFLHKNTMQNRLNRIAAQTGYNPRVLADYSTLAAAFTLRDYLAFKN